MSARTDPTRAKLTFHFQSEDITIRIDFLSIFKCVGVCNNIISSLNAKHFTRTIQNENIGIAK